ncbi:hypothetical protein D5S17_01535 [Pseudonocardiaceae bacterium YIM PH 21723]|nr:hypothetical protein D5S17_01535 [Pseudonocardiaceae bacterium YIM PH 21723]
MNITDTVDRAVDALVVPLTRRQLSEPYEELWDLISDKLGESVDEAPLRRFISDPEGQQEQSVIKYLVSRSATEDARFAERLELLVAELAPLAMVPEPRVSAESTGNPSSSPFAELIPLAILLLIGLGVFVTLWFFGGP